MLNVPFVKELIKKGNVHIHLNNNLITIKFILIKK